VEAFLGKMDLAVDQDAEANQQGRPAIHKLVMLKEVEEVLENIHLHEDLLEAGLLNILKQWLEPLGDGSIPNVNVRTTLLRLLKKLPINVEMFDRREQLKKSGLGRMIMFYYKLPEESLTNKRTAQWLVEKWSRPIFELSTRYDCLLTF
jgi:transcription factor SPN1